MDNVTSFRIEEESFLESIGEEGLSWMSYQNYDENARRSILVLPSTVTSIAEHGLRYNNLIKTIYYCGSTHLSNFSELMTRVSAPDIKVTSSYTHDKIFGSSNQIQPENRLQRQKRNAGVMTQNESGSRHSRNEFTTEKYEVPNYVVRVPDIKVTSSYTHDLIF